MLTDQLAALRRSKQVPAPELGARTGVTPSAIYAAEHGRRDVRASTAAALAHGLGARLLVVDTENRSNVAEASQVIAAAIIRHDRDSAARALLQLSSDLTASSPLVVAALIADPPTETGPGWSWAIAGIADRAAKRVGSPVPVWVSATAGDPSARWTPWDPRMTHLIDPDAVPEELRGRGVFIEAGELESA